MDFENPLQEFVIMGRVAEELDVFGMKVKMRILNSGQRRDILEETGGLDGVTRAHQIQILTLSRAIVSVNGKRIQYTPKTKDEPITIEKTVNQNKECLEQVQQPVLDYLYEKYAELVEHQTQKIEELKKKSVKAGQEPSGPLESPQVSIES